MLSWNQTHSAYVSMIFIKIEGGRTFDGAARGFDDVLAMRSYCRLQNVRE